MAEEVESTTTEEWLSLEEYIEKEIKPKQRNETKKHCENNILFVGETDSGKTTLLNILLGRKEKSNPTITPSFDFAVKDDVKANIWEMGQVVHKGIAAIPMNMRGSNGKVIIVIVLDLSKPENVITALTEWLTFLRSASLLLCDKDGERKQPRESNENDNAFINNIPFELLIVGNKYDKFKNEESMKRKVICSALRYFTHIYNSNLVFASAKDKIARDNFKKIARELVFSNDVDRKIKRIKQNSEESEGPLLIINIERNNGKKSPRQDLLEDITKSLPSNAAKSIVSRNTLFSSHWTQDVLNVWMALSSSIFGKHSFHLDHKSFAKETREMLNRYPNEKIDLLLAEADEEIKNMRSKMAFRTGLFKMNELINELNGINSKST